MTAAPASADVLVNYDGGTVRLGQSLDVGVWYQAFSGGPRGYWEGVWSHPQHKWIFTQSGQASPAVPIKIWPVKPHVRGEHDTVLRHDEQRPHLPDGVPHQGQVGGLS